MAVRPEEPAKPQRVKAQRLMQTLILISVMRRWTDTQNVTAIRIKMETGLAASMQNWKTGTTRVKAHGFTRIVRRNCRAEGGLMFILVRVDAIGIAASKKAVAIATVR